VYTHTNLSIYVYLSIYLYVYIYIHTHIYMDHSPNIRRRTAARGRSIAPRRRVLSWRRSCRSSTANRSQCRGYGATLTSASPGSSPHYPTRRPWESQCDHVAGEVTSESTEGISEIWVAAAQRTLRCRRVHRHNAQHGTHGNRNVI